MAEGHIKPYFFALLAVLILTACEATPPPTATVVPQAVVFDATWTPKPTRTPVPPPTRRPPRTSAAPTLPIIILSPNQTESIEDLALATLWAPFMACSNYQDKEKISPNGNWYICGYASGFNVTNRDGTFWTFSPENEFGFEYYGDFRLLHWTQDEKFLYFAVMNPVDGPGPFTANAEALLRMDLTNGKVTLVLGSLDVNSPNHDFYAISISPTSRRLVYSDGYLYRDAPPLTKLHIVDLQSGDETIIPIEQEYSQIGNFAWSKDGLTLAYKLYNTGFEGYCEYSYSVRLLNLSNQGSLTLVKNIKINQCENPQIEYDVQNGFENNIILEKDNEIWQFNIASQRLTLFATKTPEP